MILSRNFCLRKFLRLLSKHLKSYSFFQPSHFSVETNLSKMSFQNLSPLDLNRKDALLSPIPLGPEGLIHGVLKNGLTFYVKKNEKPSKRVALALGVRVGSVLESDFERGVAHIVEHLAFNATQTFSNFDLVHFLEGIGAEFGACQNAYTSADETVFELLIPVDKPAILSQSIAVLAEFGSKIRISDEDLNKERGAILAEWREGRNASGRMQEAHWTVLMQGSKYADRQPIGLEKIIRSVPGSVVREFYKRWYKPQNMAVVAVGDFESPERVVELIKQHFDTNENENQIKYFIPIPEFPFIPHSEPRFSIFVDKEASGSTVSISWKTEPKSLLTIADYRQYLLDELFNLAMNQRFYKISRYSNPPFYSCSFHSESLVKPVHAYIISSSCKHGQTVNAIKSILTEIARVRLYGFSAQEIHLIKSLYISHLESALLEKNQMQSTQIRDEYIQHFLRKEAAPGIEYESQMVKTLIPNITASQISDLANYLIKENSCVIKTTEVSRKERLETIKSAMDEIFCLEKGRSIPPWEDQTIPEQILLSQPTPGTVLSSQLFPKIDATEIILSNGMKVCYKRTNFLDDQILISGFAYGGLSEASEKEFYSFSMATTIASEMGVFGHSPSVMSDLLAGKRANISMKISAYMRVITGDCSPSDFETALQLIYQLFTTNVTAVDSELNSVMQLADDLISAQQRDPFTAFTNRVREINYGSSFYFKPVSSDDLKKVKPKESCEYFNSSFSDPSSFTMAIVGNMQHHDALPLIQKYLGGIPKPSENVMNFKRDDLSPLPIHFPQSIIREEVRKQMIQSQSSTQITFPIQLNGEDALEDTFWTSFMCKLMESKIMQLLRFQHGKIYSVSVSAFLGGSRPSAMEDVKKGDMAINFSSEPQATSKLVDLVLNEIEKLQEVKVTEKDIQSILEIEKRNYETALHENSFWIDKILRAYHSRNYLGDLDHSFLLDEAARNTVIERMNADSMKEALRRILPFPCKSHHTVVVLKPTSPLWSYWENFSFSSLSTEKQVLITSVLALGCFTIWRYIQ